MTTTIKVLNWNARGIKNKKEELSTYIDDYDIIVVTETKSNNKDSLKFKGFNVIEKKFLKRINSAGGLAIIIRKDLKIKKLDDINLNVSSIEILGINVEGLDRELNCFAMYVDRVQLKIEIRGEK